MRRTLDWQNEALVRERLIPEFRPKVEAWNATFDVPYHAFRARVKQIAQLNLRHVEGAASSVLEEVPAGHIIVPVDDDDWLAPDLADHLRRAHESGMRGYFWRHAVIEPLAWTVTARRRVARLLGRRDKYTCKTNNYAVASDPATSGLVLSHVTASAYFDAHPAAIKRIPATLGIQNRNPASRTTLAWNRPSLSRHELLAIMRRYRTLYSSWKVRDDLRWAAPYVDMMAELIREVGVK